MKSWISSRLSRVLGYFLYTTPCFLENRTYFDVSYFNSELRKNAEKIDYSWPYEGLFAKYSPWEFLLYFHKHNNSCVDCLNVICQQINSPAERVESTLNGRLRLTVLRVYRFVSVVSNVFLITIEKARIELLSPICNWKKTKYVHRTCVVIYQFFKYDQKIPCMSWLSWDMRGFFFFALKKKREKIFHTCTMNMRGYFFHP